MRNIFDQYAQPENRVTHALISTFHKDRLLLRRFLSDLVQVDPPRSVSELNVFEQQYPGELEKSEEELEAKGIPDAWICDEEREWCVVIENKVLAKPTIDQIERHLRVARRMGFKHVFPVVITARNSASLATHARVLKWRQVYTWLRSHSRDHLWAKECASYLEIIEARMIEAGQYVEGTLTMFTGFPFGADHPVTYLEAKRVLGLAMQELRARKSLQEHLGAELALPGRPAITSSQGQSVWDLIRLSPTGDSTDSLHLTLGVRPEYVDAMVTVPNSVASPVRKRLVALGEEGFREMMEQIVGNMRPLLAGDPGIVPLFRGIQRRYRTQRSIPEVDALIEFDLRTIASVGGPPKTQPLWLSAAYGAFIEKRHSNYQIQVGALYKNDKCPQVRDPEAINLIEKTWLACKPLIDSIRS